MVAGNAICGVRGLETASLQFSPRDTRDRYLARREPHAQALRGQSARGKRHARRRACRPGDDNGAAVWRRIAAAVGERANNTPPGPVH
jgi:hypothetical protein